MYHSILCQRHFSIFSRLSKPLFSVSRINVTCKQTTIKHERSFSTNESKKGVRIGCGSGFWGDSSFAGHQLVERGNIDYLVLDYLSEITMSLLTAARRKNEDLGYAPDFVQAVMKPSIKSIKEKGIRVVTNAGGINPASCGKAIKQLAEESGVELDVAVVTGDDLMPNIEALRESVVEMRSGLPVPKTTVSMNAYVGAEPIAKALRLGADVVVTGRCVDSALALGPLLHEFNWSMTDYDRLAAGSLAGHLIECGAQCTGGIFTDWHQVPNWADIGFPIADVREDGSMLICKPRNSGGLINRGTVAEQMLYEIGDPENYVLPDVCADFSQVQIAELTKDIVEVTGAKGQAPPKQFKVSGTYVTGYRLTAVCTIGGPHCAEKGKRTAQELLKRCHHVFQKLGMDDFNQTHIQFLGGEDSYGSLAKNTFARDGAVWIAATHTDKRALEILAREIASAGTGMAPGFTGLVGGRPKPSPVLKLFSCLYPRENVELEIMLNGESKDRFTCGITTSIDPPKVDKAESKETSLLSGSMTYRVEDLAFTRSGDKGNDANIGVIARDPSYLPYLRQVLTVPALTQYFRHLWSSDVTPVVRRYDVPGISGMNFVLEDCLGGGGVASLRSDPQGKALGQMLLDFEIKDVPELIK